MKKVVPFLVAVVLIAIVAGGIISWPIIQQYIPSKEMADPAEVFHAEGTQVALILDDEIQEEQGIYEAGQIYLPLNWVNENINERFYWDEEQKLIYTLPEQIIYADKETVGSGGKPLLLVKEDNIYLSSAIVNTYTDIRQESYEEGSLHWLYVSREWGEENWAEVKKNGKVRTKGGIKSPILTEAAAGDQVKILEHMDKWSRIKTEDGFVGYIENRKLGNREQRIQKSTFIEPVYTSISMEDKVCMVWHQVTTMAANNQLSQLIGNTKGVNVVSPTWFALSDNEGNYRSLASKSYVDQAHELGMQVWALVDNFSSEVDSKILLSSNSRREKIIQSLIREAGEIGFDGINLDFEGISKEAGIHYVQFIRELSIECRKSGLVLSVDNYVPAAYNSFYNRTEQGIVADYVIIMGYDEHFAGGEAGSVASYNYVKDGMNNTMAMVPREKIINGIPFYTRVWTEKESAVTSEAMGIARAKQWITDNHVELYWQEELGQYYGESVKDFEKQMIWMEEEKSLGLKMDLIRDYDLAGVACWKLGFESPEIWDVVWVNKNKT